MSKRVLSGLALPLLGLLLVLLLFCLPNQSQGLPPLLELSVILRESDGFATARQGMEQAAADLNVELRFLSPSSGSGAEEQAQLLEREVESGAAAVLLIPADREALAEPVRAAAGRAVVVTLETDMTEQGAQVFIGGDNAALGEALAMAALNGVPRGGAALLLDSLPGDNAVTERLEAAAGLLEEKGRNVLIRQPDRMDLQQFLSTHQVDVILAFDASALEEASEAARYTEGFPLLYGAGSTAAIAAGLEQNRVTAIAAQNNFSAGYLAIQSAAGLVRKEAVPAAGPLPFTILRQETMYEPENQKLLFPVI